MLAWFVVPSVRADGTVVSVEQGRVPANGVLRIEVPDAVGSKTVIGQLTVARVTTAGFVTAFGCLDGLPQTAGVGVTKSDLNFDGRISPVWSNRLIVQADENGDICLYTSAHADMVVDVNAVSFDTGITSFPNQRTDTRGGSAVAAGGTLKVAVPDAAGAKTVVGQLTATRATGPGFVTAFPCADGLPTTAGVGVTRSDLNVDGRISPVSSNRLIVQADANGEICFHTSTSLHLVVDVNGVADSGVASFANRRTDTRQGPARSLGAGGVLRVTIPEAVGARTVLGQLTVSRATGQGYVTAYGCADGMPNTPGEGVSRSDLNYDGRIAPVWSNRLIVQADADGYVCFYTVGSVDLVIDVNGVSDTGIVSFPNHRTDTRAYQATGPTMPAAGATVPVWAPYVALPPVEGFAALTGEPAGPAVTKRPIVAVKIDNYRLARPHFGLERADVVIEENVEGVTRFIALFHTHHPDVVGPVRSARTADLDLLAPMNRPVFGYSGANAGVNAWIQGAASAGVLVDFTAQRNPCFSRTTTRPGPHNLLLDTTCAAARSSSAGAARPLWAIDASWAAPASAHEDATFTVPMDGVHVRWTWDATSGLYLRSQDDQAHVSASGDRITARNVVVLAVQHVPSPVDGRSPHPISVGSGDAVVHRNGRAVAATWERASPIEPMLFRSLDTGESIPLDRGITFLELVRS